MKSNEIVVKLRIIFGIYNRDTLGFLELFPENLFNIPVEYSLNPVTLAVVYLVPRLLVDISRLRPTIRYPHAESRYCDDVIY
jgi:hypothetical protein